MSFFGLGKIFLAASREPREKKELTSVPTDCISSRDAVPLRISYTKTIFLHKITSSLCAVQCSSPFEEQRQHCFGSEGTFIPINQALRNRRMNEIDVCLFLPRRFQISSPRLVALCNRRPHDMKQCCSASYLLHAQSRIYYARINDKWTWTESNPIPRPLTSLN